jgi:hypothetical protein
MGGHSLGLARNQILLLNILPHWRFKMLNSQAIHGLIGLLVK